MSALILMKKRSIVKAASISRMPYVMGLLLKDFLDEKGKDDGGVRAVLFFF